MLFGNPNISFAPLHIDDFVAITTLLISNLREGFSVAELCGPEDLTGVDLARRLARRFTAIPLPLWWPLVGILLKIGSATGFHAVEPDQLQRLTCQKTGSAGAGGQTGRVHFLQDENG